MTPVPQSRASEAARMLNEFVPPDMTAALLTASSSSEGAAGFVSEPSTGGDDDA